MSVWATVIYMVLLIGGWAVFLGWAYAKQHRFCRCRRGVFWAAVQRWQHQREVRRQLRNFNPRLEAARSVMDQVLAQAQQRMEETIRMRHGRQQADWEQWRL